MSYQISVTSQERYRASASQRRLYGGNTVTKFLVFDPNRPKGEQYQDEWGYGPTPPERKTYAVAMYAKRIGKSLEDIRVCRDPKGGV